MINDITIGQHLPGDSVIHRLDPRIKIVLAVAYTIILVIGTNPFGLFISVAFLLAVYHSAKIPFKMLWKSFKPLLPVLAFTTVLNVFFISGTPIFSWRFITITQEGIYFAVLMVIRIFCLIAGISLLTYTTSPIVLTDAIERLLKPLSKLRFPTHELAMMMTIALRFIPTLIEETQKIMNAQKARGAEMDSGNFLRRIKALVPVLIPLFLSAFRRADELAMAMESRCYQGGDNRTRLRQLSITSNDVLSLFVSVVIFTAIALSGFLFSTVFPTLATFQR